MNDRRNTQLIVVQVSRVLFRKEDSGWCIISTRTQTASSGDQYAQELVCKGVVGFEVKEGDRLQLEGFFSTSKFNGANEFTFQTAIPHLPADLISLLHYAVSITKGLGETRESYIWAKYGERWIEQQVLDIPGLPEKVQINWAMTLKKIGEQKNQTQAITFLLARGCTLNMANVAWAEWKDNTIGTVQGDCYQLAQLPHYGFKKVDQDIRHHFGIADDDPRRRDAAMLYVIGELSAQGSTLHDRETVRVKAADLMPMTDEDFAASIQRLTVAGKLTEIPGEGIALSRDVEIETTIFEAFKQ